MQQDHSKAIVLRSFPFKDRQKIVTLFSEKFGIISLVVKGISCKKPSTNALCEPFAESEFFFTKKSSTLFRYEEGHLIDLHLALRASLCFLKTASAMSQALLKSQMPEQAAPELYTLFSSFLKQIPSFSSQETLLGCFYLKLLKHEGLHHAKVNIPSLSPEEQMQLSNLTLAQSFLRLKEHPLTPSLFSELEHFFLQKIS
jgi:DNA repair protein RecO